MEKSPLYIFGEVLFDCFPDSEPVLGGAPFNVAWHLQAFGENPYFISAVGDDEFGEKILGAMSEWGMERKYVQIDASHPTGVVNVSFKNNEPAYDIQRDCAYDHINAGALPDLQENSVIYHGSLALRSPVSNDSLLSMTCNRCHKLFIDVNLRPPWWKFENVLASISDTYFVKLNFDELRLLHGDNTGIINSSEDIGGWLNEARQFKERHNIINLLITCGEKGSVLIDSVGEAVLSGVPPQSSSVVDTVGAGDAFASVVVLGMMNDWGWETALERAQQFASFIVTQRGAICPKRAIYDDFRNFWGLAGE